MHASPSGSVVGSVVGWVVGHRCFDAPLAWRKSEACAAVEGDDDDKVECGGCYSLEGGDATANTPLVHPTQRTARARVCCKCGEAGHCPQDLAHAYMHTAVGLVWIVCVCMCVCVCCSVVCVCCSVVCVCVCCSDVRVRVCVCIL